VTSGAVMVVVATGDQPILTAVIGRTVRVTGS
jgi:hypothetical protein